MASPAVPRSGADTGAAFAASFAGGEPAASRLRPTAGSTLSRVIESLRASRRMAIQTKRPDPLRQALPQCVTKHVLSQIMAEWWSIEVFHADLSTARQWKDSYAGALIEAALANGARNWAWHEHPAGVVLEVAFRDDAAWEAFRALPAVAAALDAAPDPVNGLIIYRGRGGSSGSRWPRRRAQAERGGDGPDRAH